MGEETVLRWVWHVLNNDPVLLQWAQTRQPKPKARRSKRSKKMDEKTAGNPTPKVEKTRKKPAKKRREVKKMTIEELIGSESQSQSDSDDDSEVSFDSVNETESSELDGSDLFSRESSDSSESAERFSGITSSSKRQRIDSSSSDLESDQWENRCAVCHKAGTLICCDGCPLVFHLKCAHLSVCPIVCCDRRRCLKGLGIAENV